MVYNLLNSAVHWHLKGPSLARHAIRDVSVPTAISYCSSANEITTRLRPWPQKIVYCSKLTAISAHSSASVPYVIMKIYEHENICIYIYVPWSQQQVSCNTLSKNLACMGSQTGIESRNPRHFKERPRNAISESTLSKWNHCINLRHFMVSIRRLCYHT